MSVTFCVLKLERSSVVSAGHFLNIQPMFVTFSVFRFSMPSMVVKSLQP